MQTSFSHRACRRRGCVSRTSPASPLVSITSSTAGGRRASRAALDSWGPAEDSQPTNNNESSDNNIKGLRLSTRETNMAHAVTEARASGCEINIWRPSSDKRTKGLPNECCPSTV